MTLDSTAQDAPLRLGLIGCGRIAQVAHLPAIAKSADVRLAAVSDPSPVLARAIGRRYDVPGYTDTEELLQAGLDAELRDLAVKLDRTVQVGAMRRHDPGVQYARAALDRLGPIASATFWYRLPTVLRASTEAALFPPLVVDESVRSELSRSGRDLHWRGSLRTSRAPASFEISANVHANYSEGVEVFGEHGAVSVRSYFPFYRQASSVRVFAEQSLEWTLPDYGAVDPYQRQLEAFARSVRQGEPADPDARDGVEALRLIEATAASAHRDGLPVEL